MHRRSAMRVRDGRVQRKSNWAPAWTPAEIQLERRDPGPGARHLITVAQLREFLGLLPHWDDVAAGLDAIVLDRAHPCLGWHWPGVVAVCAWGRDLWWHDEDPRFLDEIRPLLELLDVEVDGHDVRWTEPQARAFQLLHILPHELGHHHDRITTRTQRDAARGEPYAEANAARVLEDVWPAYAARFGL